MHVVFSFSPSAQHRPHSNPIGPRHMVPITPLVISKSSFFFSIIIFIFLLLQKGHSTFSFESILSILNPPDKYTFNQLFACI